MSKNFVPFELERLMSIWENQVDYNISESGVHPMTIRELIDDPGQLEKLLTTELNYPQANGTVELRDAVASLYPGATRENILITTGCAQANFTAVLSIMEAGDEIVVMFPNYMQIWGVAKNLGYAVKTFSLKEEDQWAIDVDELDRVITNKTKLVALVNPNNPTGRIMTTTEMEAITEACSRVGAWLLADEVYAGAERTTDEFTPSFWGRYDKVLAMGSMSKAYGLPGLRIGWVVAPEKTIQELWAWQDYITIGTTMLGNKLAAHALSPQVRPRIIARTRNYIRKGYATLEGWLEEHEDLFSIVPPQAAAIAFVHYKKKINSTDLVHRLIRKGAFVLPGDLFGLDHYLRISFGLPEEYLIEGLNRLHQVIHEAD